jgi:phosphoenolpyruvate carboxylase
MLKSLAVFSRGGDPKWYVRGFIISMASELKHLQIAAQLTKLALGEIRLPIIPLFEQLGALRHAVQITSAVLKDPTLSRALKTHWDSRFEVMLGYSDSSKESGVLQSRLAVAETMHALDSFCRRRHVTPLFFQGSGGSTDRGGGSVQEQTAWWSTSALRNYKVTVQGEMVERSLANPEITRGQLERITQSAGAWKKAAHRHLPKIKALDDFAVKVADGYRNQVASSEFLKIVEHATPYPFLNLLKMGSRPTKRSKKLSVEGLRAIPWILCWTQTRLLFPTWWGVGLAWSQTDNKNRAQLIRAYRSHPLFATYVRALGFTLAKVEIGVWNLYLEQSGLELAMIQKFQHDFEKELRGAKTFVRAILGSHELITWRPWLQESITLRSPMIHPLNLLQIIAMKQKNAALLRLSVTGISSGMMTTG